MSIVLYFVTAQGNVTVPVQPVGDTYASGQFDTHTVAVFDIAGQSLTDFADFATKDQLIVIIHKIEVGTDTETLVTEAITGFIIVQGFVCGTFMGFGFREIVAVRFPVGNGEGDESIMAVFLEIDARFRVEKVPVLVYIDVTAGFVVTSFNRIAGRDIRSDTGGTGSCLLHKSYSPICFLCYGNIRSLVVEVLLRSLPT